MSLWEILRPVTNIAVEFNFAAESLAMILSIAILAISLLAYRKAKTRRLLLVTAAFFFFALKWVLRIADQFISPGFFFSRASDAIADLLILAILFYAIFKK